MLRNKNLICFYSVLVIIFVLLSFSCTSKFQKAKKALPELDREFLTSVQYLITSREKKIFVYLSKDERDDFIKDFWKKRDPSPKTEENEYKDTYYQRMREATSLFISSGKNGWLTDRGRTYILFGPPDRRDIYPTGYSFHEPPVEVWFYGMFPVIFVDEYRDGSYKIVYSSYRYLQQISSVEMVLHPKYDTWNKNLVGKMKIENSEKGVQLIQADIPYKAIVFNKKKNKYIGILVLEAKIFKNDIEINIIKKNIEIKITEEELKKLPDLYKIKEPIELKPGKYKIELKITDKTSGKGIYRTILINV